MLQGKPVTALEERVRAWHNENLQHVTLCWKVSAGCVLVIVLSTVAALMRALLWHL